MSAVASAWASTTMTLRLTGDGGKDPVGGVKGAIDGTHEGPTQDGENGDWRAVAGAGQGKLPAGGLRREVGRLAQPFVVLEGVDDLSLLVDVIAQGDEIDAAVAQAAIQARGQPGPAGGVLRIGDDQIEPLAADQLGHGLADEVDARRAHDVANEEDVAFQ